MRFNKGFAKVAFIPLVTGAAGMLARGVARKAIGSPGAALNTGLNALGAKSDFDTISQKLRAGNRT